MKARYTAMRERIDFHFARLRRQRTFKNRFISLNTLNKPSLRRNLQTSFLVPNRAKFSVAQRSISKEQ